MTSKTNRTRSLRPSPALVIACVALFAALTGSAIAAGLGKNTVRSPQIVNGSVRTADLQRDAVRSGKIADGTVAAADLGSDSVGSDEIAEEAVGSPEVAADSLTADDLAAASVTSTEVADQTLGAADIGPDAVGASELGAVTVRSKGEPIANGANGGVSVQCAAGEQVLGGGGQPGHFGVEMTSSRPSGNGWLYQAKNNSGSNSTITAYALCLG